MHYYKHSLLPIRIRNADAFKLPFCTTNTRQFSVSYQGPKYFNSLDNDICNSISLSFKSIWKIILLTAISQEELNSFIIIEVYLSSYYNICCL